MERELGALRILRGSQEKRYMERLNQLCTQLTNTAPRTGKAVIRIRLVERNNWTDYISDDDDINNLLSECFAGILRRKGYEFTVDTELKEEKTVVLDGGVQPDLLIEWVRYFNVRVR